jgi:hypothetical protein
MPLSAPFGINACELRTGTAFRFGNLKSGSDFIRRAVPYLNAMDFRASDTQKCFAWLFGFTAHVVADFTLINIDLSWNPSRLELRLRRIKRFGQARRSVEMLNLVYHETQDEKVYQVLSRRLKDKFDIFGGLPDTIEDDWIASVSSTCATKKRSTRTKTDGTSVPGSCHART